MKIAPINLAHRVNQLQHPNYKYKSQEIASDTQTETSVNGIYYLPIMETKNSPRTISFLGKLVHIVDGGIHANNMQHFLKAVRNDADIQMHDVALNTKDRSVKQLKSAEEQLRNLCAKIRNYSGEYTAVPILASVPLLNIQDQYNKIMGENRVFTPENIKANKADILYFLKKIYDNPNQYSEYISYMDPLSQGIEHTYGVIQAINAIIKKGNSVYVPSGHPNDLTLKWMAAQKGLKPELYHYIATGKDMNNSVAGMRQEIIDKNWYTFNLLSLSEARIVGLKSPDWQHDFIFSAYDSCITDVARGVYNLSPLRVDGNLLGYSFTENYMNDYPYEEFPMNKQVENLVEFVGKNRKDVLATVDETELLRSHLKGEIPITSVPDKLYPIRDVFPLGKIKSERIDLQGEYVDKTLTLFFDENDEDKIIFKKCDCEGSGRPSVLSVWGSCYATLNAIARDIGFSEQISTLDRDFARDLESAKQVLEGSNKVFAMHYGEIYLSRLCDTAKQLVLHNSFSPQTAIPFEMLGAIYEDKGNIDGALGCFNEALDIISKSFCRNTSIKSLKNLTVDNVYSYNSYSYDTAYRNYKDVISVGHWNDSIPGGSTRPADKFKLYVLKMSLIYKRIAELCRYKGESYPAAVCEAASKDIICCSLRGDAIIRRRADGIQYIGDLYDEIKQH